MNDLIAFLNARLDEDEAAAKAVTFRSRFMAVDISVKSPGGLGNPPMPIADVIDAQTAAHIARHDPARVLREVAAKREILADHVRVIPSHGPYESCCGCCGAVYDDAYLATSWPCDTVRYLAAVYSDHPDYRDEWKP